MPARQNDTLRALPLSTRLLPPSLRWGSTDETRAARVLLTGIASSLAICLLFAVIHSAGGQLARALVSALTCLPIIATLGLLWWTGRVVPAVHSLLGICTGIILVSPFLSHQGEPAIVALVIVPVAAALLGGSRAGAVWGVVITTLLIGYASLYPFSDADRKNVWLTVIISSGGGLAATLIERGREQAARTAELARAEAEADARDRLLAERALHESRALFATAFRRSTSILILFSFEAGRILDVNETFTRVTGWTADEALGKTVAELNGWTSSEDRLRIFAGATAKGRIEAVEIRMRMKSGALRWLFGSIEVLEQEGQDCLLAEGVDITDRKRNEDALARYREQLEQRFVERGAQLQESLELLRQRDRLAAVGTLAAGVAHQINNPIGAIVAATEFAAIMEDDPDRERIRTDAISIAHEEALRCGRIVKNVLKFSRDEPTAKWVEDLTPTIRRASELARRHVAERGGQLDLDLTPGPLEVRASPIEIEQVVLNLIHNAAESRQSGARVRVETKEVDGFAEIRIIDDGHGIDPSVLPHIFEPFYTSRLADGGSGLGLSVVHGIVGDHGGKLEVEAAPEGGTRIRVLLPLSQERQNVSV